MRGMVDVVNVRKNRPASRKNPSSNNPPVPPNIDGVGALNASATGFNGATSGTGGAGGGGYRRVRQSHGGGSRGNGRPEAPNGTLNSPGDLPEEGDGAVDEGGHLFAVDGGSYSARPRKRAREGDRGGRWDGGGHGCAGEFSPDGGCGSQQHSGSASRHEVSVNRSWSA